MASKLFDGTLKFKDVPGLKPVFRMNPPRKGYGSTRRPYKLKGALGYMGKDINGLIDRMLEGGELGKTEKEKEREEEREGPVLENTDGSGW
jgi:large subunit ribosomal protein L30